MYVPARFDFTDLYPILAFFRGSPDRPNYGFDTTAKAIAVNGRCFVEKMFRRDDIQVYMLRVLLEWADLIDESRD
jgi:hypothetical protein